MERNHEKPLSYRTGVLQISTYFAAAYLSEYGRMARCLALLIAVVNSR